MAQSGSVSTERFLDIQEEPTKRLSPIVGYELKPLVSLGEAVHTLEPLITNIQSYVWTATGNSENPQDALTLDESAAIYLYTMEAMYRQLNKALRNEQRQELILYFSYLKLLLTALWKLEDVKASVWRGMKGNFADQYPKGKKFVWWGFSSCTDSLGILQAEQFLGEMGPRTLFNIRCFNGKRIHNHSHFPNENEILLMPCSYFEVTDHLKQGTDLSIVELQQIVPPVVLIEPPFAVCGSANRQTLTDPVDKLCEINIETEETKIFQFCLNFYIMKPRLKLSTASGPYHMAIYKENLLYCQPGKLCLIDRNGIEQLNVDVQRDLTISDMCWSSYWNQFLIFDNRRLYSFDMSDSTTERTTPIREFDYTKSCTCYEKRFLIGNLVAVKRLLVSGYSTVIEEYDLSNWQFNRAYKLHTSHTSREDTLQICNIRFSSNGTKLGVILRKGLGDKNGFGEYRSHCFSFELRNSNKMSLLQNVQLDVGSPGGSWLLSLPNSQFLINLKEKKKFFFIDSDGRLKETVDYSIDVKYLGTTAWIKDRCLVIRTVEPDELRFYDL